MKYLLLLLGVCLTAINAQNCPDGQSCPYGSSQCCQEEDGTFGCCPFLEAVCCSDTQCCPKGTTCNVEKGTCVGAALSIPFPWMMDLSDPEVYSAGVFKAQKLRKQLQKMPEMQTDFMGNEVESNKIDEDNVLCPDSSNCPFPNGDCCGNFVYCCPEGYNCDSKKKLCLLAHEKADSPKTFPIYNMKDDSFDPSVTSLEEEDPFCDHCSKYKQSCCKGLLDVKFCCPEFTKCSTIPYICLPDV